MRGTALGGPRHTEPARRPTIPPFFQAGRRKAARWVERAAPTTGAAPLPAGLEGP